MTGKKILFIFTFILLTIYSGCYKPHIDKDTLVLVIKEDPSNLDPALSVDVTSGQVLAPLFNGLVRYGKDMSIIGDMAEKWEISESGTVYKFFLKNNIKFSDGSSFTAKDVIYSFKRLLSPEIKSPRTWVLARIIGAKDYIEGKNKEIKGLRILDDYTLEIEIAEPFAPFIGFLAMPNTYILSLNSKENKLIGSGPFLLKEWKHDSFIKLLRNEFYFGVKPKIQKIKYRIIPEETTAFTEFKRGVIDIINIPLAQFKSVLNNKKYKNQISSCVQLNTYYLGFNVKRPNINKKLVRQAISYAIDRKKILETILSNRGKLANGPIPPVLINNQKKSYYSYDPKKAIELLKQAGLEKGFEIDIWQKSSKEVLEIIEVIQSYLSKINIKVNIKQVEWSRLKEAVNNQEADAFYLSWYADYPDGENFLYPLFHSDNFGGAGNRSFFANPEIDNLIKETHSISDSNKRIEKYKIIQDKIIEHAPWVFLWHNKKYIVKNKRVKNIQVLPIYNAEKYEYVEFK